jgi:hypothetical protein
MVNVNLITTVIDIYVIYALTLGTLIGGLIVIDTIWAVVSDAYTVYEQISAISPTK